MNCLLCGAVTNNPRFCSRSCSVSYNNKINPKRKKKEKIVTEKIIKVTKADHFYTSKNKSNVYGLIRFKARQVAFEHKPKVCEHCGYDRHVEVCHIKPIASFDNDTPLTIINDISNLKILCPNCHWEFDNLSGQLYH